MDVNKQAVQRRFQRALPFYDKQAKAQQQINRRLLSILQNTRSDFEHILEIGCGTGHFSSLLQQHIAAKQWWLNDLCEVGEHLAARLTQPYHLIVGDAEALALARQFDLIASASTFQWFADPPRFLTRLKRHLKPNGLLLFSVFSPDNLVEIRRLTQVGLDYPSIQQWHDWLAADFQILHTESAQIRLIFESPLAVLRHLQQSGVTAVSRQVWTKGRLKRFCADYQQYYSSNGGVRLTYTPLYLLARVKA
ncbi:malonyl-ACP O-methyltransferase BioC [Muribacter muris]|uniref:Malonyl-[acyl-carrier protein] O-methyltransferase n=1 Tax=Muribacter muris TaxID=67855 RepID=A0A4Y9JTX6_9PAST|nr:malonyl-ACP O-methyltransferase BioC [Muribacter muris]MBF0785694.1 malonyl-ACP O-methyltransferase BioC [Muribacter muris]MBF0827729.1 malonyl-ACP O-methyltransferase BioC [Muribacter muris]TFV08772.1 malonyl-ACP O-methyltransferase BioC [Muribacter muris]